MRGGVLGGRAAAGRGARARAPRVRGAGRRGGEDLGRDHARPRRRLGRQEAQTRYRRRVDHGQARRPRRRGRRVRVLGQRREPGSAAHLRQLPAAPHRRARHGQSPVPRGCQGVRRRTARGGHHRLGRPFAVAVAQARVRAGGHRLQGGRRGAHPPDRRRHRAWRRGRQDHLLRQRHRAAHERHVRRRHGCVHRPDGEPSAHRRERPQRARQAGRDHLPHREPLRRLRQDRRAAAAQRGR